MENKPNRIIWHHSAVEGYGSQATGINNEHKKRKFPLSMLGFYGGYHILIERDGTVVRFRADNEVGAHDYGENINSLGICLAGNFNSQHPTKEQETAFVKQLLEWKLKWNIPENRIDPHRIGDSTDCPGKLLPDDWPKQLLAKSGGASTKDILIDIIKYIETKLNA